MMKSKNGFTIALILLFAIASVVLTRPQAAPAVSSVSGLVALKTMAQTAMPYELALANRKPTLIEFYADWCTTCQALSPTLDALHKQWGDRVNFVMLNIDDPQWTREIEQFQVNGVPHLAVLDGAHTVTDTFIGNTPRSILNTAFKRILS